MQKNKIEPIPEDFESLESAGDFWDQHSASDYWDELEEVSVVFEIKQRTFLVPVKEHLYQRLQKRAEAENISVKDVLKTLIEKELA